MLTFVPIRADGFAMRHPADIPRSLRQLYPRSPVRARMAMGLAWGDPGGRRVLRTNSVGLATCVVIPVALTAGIAQAIGVLGDRTDVLVCSVMILGAAASAFGLRRGWFDRPVNIRRWA